MNTPNKQTELEKEILNVSHKFIDDKSYSKKEKDVFIEYIRGLGIKEGIKIAKKDNDKIYEQGVLDGRKGYVLKTQALADVMKIIDSWWDNLSYSNNEIQCTKNLFIRDIEELKAKLNKTAQEIK